MLSPMNKVLINLNKKVQSQIQELHDIVIELKEINPDHYHSEKWLELKKKINPITNMQE